MSRGRRFVWLLSPAAIVVGLALSLEAGRIARAALEHDYEPVTASVIEHNEFIAPAPNPAGGTRRRRVRVVLEYSREGRRHRWSGRIDGSSWLADHQVGDDVAVYVAAGEPSVIHPDPPRLSGALSRALAGVGLLVAGAWVLVKLRQPVTPPPRDRSRGHRPAD